jgi:hypothetical protein
MKNFGRPGDGRGRLAEANEDQGEGGRWGMFQIAGYMNRDDAAERSAGIHAGTTSHFESWT